MPYFSVNAGPISCIGALSPAPEKTRMLWGAAVSADLTGTVFPADDVQPAQAAAMKSMTNAIPMYIVLDGLETCIIIIVSGTMDRTRGNKKVLIYFFN